MNRFDGLRLWRANLHIAVQSDTATLAWGASVRKHGVRAQSKVGHVVKTVLSLATLVGIVPNVTTSFLEIVALGTVLVTGGFEGQEVINVVAVALVDVERLSDVVTGAVRVVVYVDHGSEAMLVILRCGDSTE